MRVSFFTKFHFFLTESRSYEMEVLTKSESEAITVVRMSPAAFEAAVAGTLRQQIPVRNDFRYPP